MRWLFLQMDARIQAFATPSTTLVSNNLKLEVTSQFSQIRAMEISKSVQNINSKKVH